jgi:phage shock protein A
LILGKFFSAVRAQLNKLASFFWEADPIAQMQYEYDRAVEQLKEGRSGLEQYRALVERVARQVKEGDRQVKRLTAHTKSLLQAGDRERAGTIALQLTRARTALASDKEQLAMHEEAYSNSLKKIQHANRKLVELKDKIQSYDADLKMSEAEAEVAKLTASFNIDVTSTFGQLEDAIQGRIDANRGKARVASDLASEGLDKIEADEQAEKQLASDTLAALENELGIGAATKEAEPEPTTQTQPAPKLTE